MLPFSQVTSDWIECLLPQVAAMFQPGYFPGSPVTLKTQLKLPFFYFNARKEQMKV
jgi:hypothetical protein